MVCGQPASDTLIRCGVSYTNTVLADRWRKDETEAAKETPYSRAYYVRCEKHCDDDAKMQCELGWVCGG